MKLCPKCNKEKPEKEFGGHGYCKECRSEYDKDRIKRKTGFIYDAY